MRDTTFIYCLTEPNSKTVRYFGKTNDIRKRFREHLNPIRCPHLHSARWIKKLTAAGKKPDLHILCEVPKDDFERFERAFITLGRQSGMQLTNLTDGGEGLPGHSHSLETRKKMSKPKPEGFGKKVSDAQKGRAMTWGHKLYGKRTYRPMSSNFIGVYWSKPHKKWRSTIRDKGKTTEVGLFSCDETAARAWDKKAKELRGEKAKLNFPDGQ